MGQVYFRAGVLEQLEEKRGKYVRDKVLTVQRVLLGNAKRRCVCMCVCVQESFGELMLLYSSEGCLLHGGRLVAQGSKPRETIPAPPSSLSISSLFFFLSMTFVFCHLISFLLFHQL